MSHYILAQQRHKHSLCWDGNQVFEEQHIITSDSSFSWVVMSVSLCPQEGSTKLSKTGQPSDGKSLR